jgi:hypothetical protein
MPLLASLLLLAAQEPPGGEGPRGSSRVSTGERRIDLVARAAVGSGDRIEVSAEGLAAGDSVEVTALENGRTILAIGSPGSGAPAVLSPRAATALGISEGAGVRVRLAVATPQEAGALARGQAAPARIDAPASLLAALRKRLPAVSAPVASPSRPVARSIASTKSKLREVQRQRSRVGAGSRCRLLRLPVPNGLARWPMPWVEPSPAWARCTACGSVRCRIAHRPNARVHARLRSAMLRRPLFLSTDRTSHRCSRNR